ncbi:MAG: hypothetical protein WD768_10745 [Phycisphaeraceae bacterium]
MPDRPQPLTRPDGPVVTCEKTLLALASIRKLRLLPELHGTVAIALSNYEAVCEALGQVVPEAGGAVVIPPDKGFTPAPGLPWLFVLHDQPGQLLPARVDHPQNSSAAEAATLRLALSIPASLVLLDGPIKERAKLSFIKSEGTVSMLVTAYRQGLLSAVKPMVIALEKLGHGDVLPPKESLEALWVALDKMEEA